jgi:hypothetical protein
MACESIDETTAPSHFDIVDSIHTYSLSSTEGWICALKTPLAPNIQFDEIGFIASSGGVAVAMINTADLQPSIALIDLQDEKGKITSLLNPVSST